MSEVAAALRELLEGDVVSTAEGDLAAHASDWSPRTLLRQRTGSERGLPLCVVRPRSTDEVATILRWANGTRTAIVPFGGGSSVVEGIAPDGAIVLDTAEMWQVRDIDPKSLLVEVEAGVTGPQLREALDSQGFMLGHEPQSVEISTVGGWVATRACGQLSSGFGGIEDLVAGLEAVLPDGSVVRSKAVPRRAAGPDVASLMIGSEGTLGVVTAVTLRIVPRVGERSDRSIRFEHMADGVKAARAIAQAGLRPTVLRLYDREDATLFLRNHPDEPQGPLMLLSFHGDHQEERAKRAVDLSEGTEGNASLVEHWWEHRNDAVSEFRKIMSGEGLLGPHGVVDTIEVAGTWSALRDLYHSMKEALTDEADIVACHLSHVYRDGACLYFTMGSACSSDRDAIERLDRWWETALRRCLDAGGSISHHHGIGRTKAPWVAEELGGWWEVLRAVKGAIDPNGIMNPGALGL